ncbi:MAG: MmgE/PrpD family protein [Chloroflexi bacterium]|nr:MmgE/PrpD family protein [Chloroflexota bacterium]
MAVAHQLAAFAAALRFDALPPAVVHAAKRSALDWLGVAVGGALHPSTAILFDLTREVGGREQATFLARPAKGSVLDVALVNGHATHVMDYDETHGELFFHPSSAVLPALLALGEWQHLAGRRLMAAHVAAVEVGVRLLRCMYPSHYDLGWHTTGTVGTLAAAVGAGSLLGLDAQQMAHALGIAATGAAGLHENRGSMCKAFHVGQAASTGLRAALLAARGFTSRPESFEHPRGVLSLFAREPRPELAVAGLGTDWELLRIGYKPHACGFSITPLVDAALAVREQAVFAPAEVERVEIAAHHVVVEICSLPAPQTGLQGRVSAEHCVAVALSDGAVQPAQITDERVNAAEVVALRRRVAIRHDQSLRPEAAAIVVTLKDGRCLASRMEAALGTPANPVSDAQLEAKYQALAGPVLSPDVAGTLAAAVWRLDELDDVARLAAYYGCTAV